MPIVEVVFYLFATILTLAALSVITVKNPVYAALFLVLAFFSSAAIWMLLEAEFLAITLVLVYVGAVMVLFLFVVMMLDINIDRIREGFARYLPVGILVAFIMVGEMLMVIWSKSDAGNKLLSAGNPEGFSNTAYLGERLYNAYLYPFEIAAVVLLVAIIAAIALTHRGKPTGGRYQNPDRQVRVRAQDRFRKVSLPATDGNNLGRGVADRNDDKLSTAIQEET